MLIESGNRIILENSSVSMTIQNLRGGLSRCCIRGTLSYLPNSLDISPSWPVMSMIRIQLYGGQRVEREGKVLRDQSPEFNIHVNNPEMVDISFTPKQPEGFPFKMELHYVLRAGDSGFYYYVVASKPENTGDAVLTQLRFGMRLNDSMVNIRVNDKLSGVIPIARQYPAQRAW